MSRRNNLWFQAALRRPWVVYSVCTLVALLPVPLWLSQYQDTQDRKDRDPVTVTATRVVEQGNNDLVSARVAGKLISFQYPGSISVGDRVDLYRSDSQWKAVEQTPLWVPFAATALCWGMVAIVIWRYPPLARRRGWR